MQMQKSYMATQSDTNKKWYLLDADNQILGRLAVKIATILMGKHQPTYTPHIDTGDFIVVVNAKKLVVSGKKLQDKNYYTWSGYPSGLKVKNLEALLDKHPERVIYLAVRRMLPKNKMGRKMLKKLKVYSGPTHPHSAQCPQEWKDPQ